MGQLLELWPTLALVLAVLPLLAVVLSRPLLVHHTGVSVPVPRLPVVTLLIRLHRLLAERPLLALLESLLRLLTVTVLHLESHRLLGLVHDGVLPRW